MLTLAKLQLILPSANPVVLQAFLTPLLQTMTGHDINTKDRIAAFIAQTAHESANYSRLSENLNYSEQALIKLFKRYRDNPKKAKEHARKPQLIANFNYRDRMGNGNEASNDGWNYRGRGIIQITGKNNYRICGEAIRQDLLRVPELLEMPRCATWSAGWFWKLNKLNGFADKKDIRGMTQIINGGYNGLDERIELYKRAMSVL